MEGKAIKKRIENDKGHKPKNCPNKKTPSILFLVAFLKLKIKGVTYGNHQ
jgi:hypothetical protein